jgi:signal transduction histidine kinase
VPDQQSQARRGWLSLRARVAALLAGLMLATTAGAVYSFFYAQRTQTIFSELENREMAPLIAAQALENSFTTQKGYVTYYMLTGDPEWLTKLEAQRKAFEHGLARARELENREDGRRLLNRIESEYYRYAGARDEIISLYREGRTQEGEARQWKIREQFQQINDLTEEYKRLHEDDIAEVSADYSQRARALTGVSLAAILLTTFLGLWLGWVLFTQILEPIRRLASGASPGTLFNEVGALSDRVGALLEDVNQAKTLLAESRETLRQTEKLALVGKLAAGVAHSIRNPLTSVKMRLFSLERSLRLEPQEKEDFEVIADEIKHLDTIIRNFLEFSRRPKLKVQKVSPSAVVDMTLQLLKHRLESFNVEVEVLRDGPLPEVDADPEQLKEVLVNLILNACDAMGSGGRIEISEEKGIVPPLGRAVVIRVSDSGPGIPAELQEEVFQPFFSTKEEGTGLGLPIAKRILEEHGGWLHLHSVEGRGATFVLALPSKGDTSWPRS